MNLKRFVKSTSCKNLKSKIFEDSAIILIENSGLRIVDTSNSTDPFKVCYHERYLKDITFKGDYLYSTEGHFGICDCS